jgi:hypothetical protein
MKVLSIDVGIKNLAYCLFDFNEITNKQEIVLWNVINLCGEEPSCTSPACKKKAKYCSGNNTVKLCLVHAKKSSFILPTATFSIKKIKKMKLTDLHKVIKDHNVPLKPTDQKKEDILKTVLYFFDEKMLQSVATSSANDLNLIQIGVAMKKAFDLEFVNHLLTIDQIIIENQISPIANRMKTLQGMIAQYFIMHDIINIDFISAANKLKGAVAPFNPPLSEVTVAKGAAAPLGLEGAAAPLGLKGGAAPLGLEGGAAPLGLEGATAPFTYAFRKKEGIRITLQLLEDDSNQNYKKWLPHFKTHKKKDDLADAFLQGIWYLKKK